jgi:hypothetical protein
VRCVLCCAVQHHVRAQHGRAAGYAGLPLPLHGMGVHQPSPFITAFLAMVGQGFRGFYWWAKPKKPIRHFFLLLCLLVGQQYLYSCCGRALM